ncbi:MAG: pyridoxal phosphate-dependent aminotransferase [Lachnospiraceae bacterium]|nr:pyridoxal phosphate-dependent aminotransferase [Lachnospiraceae bacterium]
MSYNFDIPVNRRNTNSLKWNVGEKELPMWVADMDFETAPEIREALAARVAHGVFGYTDIPDAWYQAYIGWWEARHDFKMEKDWLIFCTGVVPAISSIVRKLTTPAEKVLIQTPVYNIFFNSILNNGRQVLESPLLYDREMGAYSIDFADLEEKLSDPQTSLMILCNPHNPVGKIWDTETLARIGELCRKYHVIVVSDEIHCDITAPGRAYTPFASVSETCRAPSATCIAPTQAFNLAGLQTAAVSVPNETLRHKVWRGLNTDEVAEPNTFAVDAAIAAFTKGGAWLDELRAYIQENKEMAAKYIAEQIPKLGVVPSEATYLMWLECKLETSMAEGALQCGNAEGGLAADVAHFVREKTGLYLSEGSQYGASGSHFLRLNVACPNAVMQDGLHRLKEGLEAYRSRF